ncbi:oligopeptide/dipeptide ABC transporter ATP-binding protein [Nesterenkonia muleiensis]|uniref:oligopeptide/dipeptide ABC transporter ATP-binding protein n=1 Tax=Nesterenkonia muleiensis TaxID=2282648 RepID=UPI00192E5C74|nr:oligopeptide/dipeptide ABC transporter ATP-binding protein [Nesterenkonia muleiensis]
MNMRERQRTRGEEKTPPLIVENLSVHYPLRGRRNVVAIDDVSFFIEAGETIGLVGESGSGKSTIGKALLGMAPVTEGAVTYASDSDSDTKKIPGLRQMVFQDPFGSFNPRWKIRRSLAEPLRPHGLVRGEIRSRVEEAIESVGLSVSYLDRFPHEFSGGQRQRISIARALINRPEVLIADEAVSALDVSVQAQVLNSMKQLQQEHQVATIFISHDLSVVQFIADRVIVLYFGQIMEEASAAGIFAKPKHPYAVALLGALPSVKTTTKDRIQVRGEPPSQENQTKGCPFASRCPFALETCVQERPAIRIMPDGGSVACHRVNDDGSRDYDISSAIEHFEDIKE